MLTEEQAQEIERGRREGLSGPVLQRWVDDLLQDRRERIEQVSYIRQRARQAFENLDRLFGGGATAAATARRERAPRGGTRR